MIEDIVEIGGNWIGYYTYEFPEQEKIPFRLTIERGINEFVGRITEEVDYGGIDDEIVIKGRQNGDDIEFTKFYTLEHFDNGNGQMVSMESETPTIVYYKGTFDHGEKKFKGSWEIPGLRECDDGVFHEENQTGTWVLWRE
jgi:hypothetical protein